MNLLISDGKRCFQTFSQFMSNIYQTPRPTSYLNYNYQFGLLKSLSIFCLDRRTSDETRDDNLSEREALVSIIIK